MWPGQIFFRSLERSNFLIGLAVIRQWQFTQSYYFAYCNLRDRVILPIAIYVIVLFCRSQFTWSCYFSRSKVRTPDQTVRSFYWSWVQFPGQIACVRPVWFMAYARWFSNKTNSFATSRTVLNFFRWLKTSLCNILCLLLAKPKKYHFSIFLEV